MILQADNRNFSQNLLEVSAFYIEGHIFSLLETKIWGFVLFYALL